MIDSCQAGRCRTRSSGHRRRPGHRRGTSVTPTVRGDLSGDATLDVFLSGLLFFDLVFTGIEHPPAPGAEVWTRDMGAGPGGIANFAVTLRRFGLRTGLAAAFGEDFHGRYCWQSLAGEGVDLSRSRRFADWPMPVTVSLAYQSD